MENKKIIYFSFLHSIGVLAYIFFVASIMSYGERIFGKMNNLVGPVAILLLFVLSAAIVGALVLGRPILFYLDGLKKEALKFFFYTVGFMAMFTFLFFTIMFLSK